MREKCLQICSEVWGAIWGGEREGLLAEGLWFGKSRVLTWMDVRGHAGSVDKVVTHKLTSVDGVKVEGVRFDK